MKKIFASLINNITFTGNIKIDSQKLLKNYHQFVTAEHSLRVAKEAKVLAERYGINNEKAEIAGLLHDISGIYPSDERLKIAEELGLNIFEEERVLPLILHQRISAIMAEELFHVHDKEILSAIACHTTLKAKASKMDMVLFVADKIQWDKEGVPPYLDELEKSLSVSLKNGTFSYIKYQLKHAKIIHPWLREAYKDLLNN
ncbi:MULTISPECIES: bis(5'-nucleosyl)-tetraphosphatase (symmetrical) YqeK [Clostridium]|uniref:bis(5'-nucleosyl)-tetraphosphatase (symmetrical) YqeK n=1 Tax=Clostridium TaxID=1485 RepID=UPI0008249CF9|nr:MULTISPECIES: bis(5'-nucleosyl)-tetraphosphatase (symmetrical) YqeK [Clostridium]PJI09560.1 HAD family hydrolase [Clostridium sp. CT7]